MLIQLLFTFFVSTTQGLVPDVLSDCQPIQDLSFCQNELVDLADTIRFVILQNPGYEDLFKVDDIDVASILEKLAKKLQTNLEQCPCINTCTNIEICQDPNFIDAFEVEDVEEEENLSDTVLFTSLD